VVGDVGVRFGGSEHHRIAISSSHTRHPPLRAGRPRGTSGALRSIARRPRWSRETDLFGGTAPGS
jgi:hypothetical protein